MALDGTKVINVNNIAAYVADSDVAEPNTTTAILAAFDFVNPPATLAAGAGPGTEWGLIGHTSEETAVSITPEVEGNERLGSLQRPALRRSAARPAYTVNIPALQGDNRVLQLYFGGGDTTGDDVFGIPQTFTPQRRALYLVMSDAVAPLAWYFADSQSTPSGDATFDPASLVEFGLAMALLPSDTDTDLGRIYRDGLGTPV